MNADGGTATKPVTMPPPARRADAGIVRIGSRDILGPLLCARLRSMIMGVWWGWHATK